ncbi:MAG: antibiotic biosynthesis monooxygenase [Planctomycetota bacterium]|nr:antibiotic biosynthesis monooxygenase [Planctomycetota bacterium]
MVHVVAAISVAPGRRAEFVEHFKALVPAVHAEQGCIEYGPTIDVQTGIDRQIPLRPDVVTVVEKWESLDALKAHLGAPHMLAFRDKVKGLVLKVELQILQPA